MVKAYRVLAYVLAGLVVVQAMAIAFALAGLGHWISHDHGVLDKKAYDAHPSFTGSVGFPIHAIDGEMVIPLVVLALLVVSRSTGIVGASRRALILLGLVVVQIFLGVISEDLPVAILFHALNAFAIFAMAAAAGWRASAQPAADAAVATPSLA